MEQTKEPTEPFKGVEIHFETGQFLTLDMVQLKDVGLNIIQAIHSKGEVKFTHANGKVFDLVKKGDNEGILILGAKDLVLH